MIDDFSQEFNKGLHRLIFLDIFEIDSPQSNEKMMETLHKLLSVVREGRHSTVRDKFIGKFILEFVDWFGPICCFDHLERVKN